MKGIARSFFVIILLGGFGLSSFAQIKDVSFTVGANVPMYKDIESDVVFNLNYSQFYRSGFGFRAGAQWSPSVANVDTYFGVPLAVAFRTSARNNAARLYHGAIGAADAIAYNGVYGSTGSDITREAAGGFLMNLFRDMEFFAGITPGYVFGSSSQVSRASWGDSWQYWEDSWTEKKQDFSMTLDAGLSLNYSIWRFDIKLIPAFHYNLTGNYLYHTSSGQEGVGVKSTNTQPLRWFFTFNGGLAFRF